MPSLRLLRVLLLPAAILPLIFLSPNEAVSQKKKRARPTGEADELLKPKPVPKRPDLAPSKTPLEFIKGERIAFVGNSTAERMNLFGNFETWLHYRFPSRELVVRNFARPAEEIGIHQRSADYTKLDDPLYAFRPDTFICFFGFNESFKGPEGIERFKKDYEKFLDDYAARYQRDDAGSKPRFVLVSPIAFEPTSDKFLPDAKKENENLKLYADAVKAVAANRKIAFIDLFTRTHELFTAATGRRFTINGCHVNEEGDRFVSHVLSDGLFGGMPGRTGPAINLTRLREAIVDKNWVHQQDYRMLNGWYVYGGRRTYDTETFPREYIKIRNMAAVRDQRIWDIAQGKPVSEEPDDSDTGELVVPPTRFGDPRQKYSEAEELRYLSPDEFIKSCTVPPGFEIKLFADEKMFPELAKPVQLNFDNKGRLWVACMPTYPQWKPGDPKPRDKLIILEDTDGDGKADKCTVFYDQLQCPTGFEFWNGGVLVMDQPRILWLKDTDGDGRADLVVHLLDGWATDDTHHRGGWEWSNGGLLHMLEGISTSTTLETPWGPHRSLGTGGAYVIDPRTLKVRQFALPGMYNMWCYVFDEWGQGIVGDGTTAHHAWDTPLSGAQYPGRKGMNFVFDEEKMRPALGCEWLVSRNFPDEVQRQFTYACVINMKGMPRFTIKDDGAGFHGERIKKDGQPFDLLRSTDKHFRPADPQMGPDGALWFGDWSNALIGHMQYSQRDPNRDHQRGRIYRMVAKDRP
ncbi:MAG TPA: PVC-type heme-binding CxxCH protein, partial [Gemmataceae bacterium]|nr:PVC-type heme-binding CxxCH protein [Gemmataceae bacterium]